MNKIIKYSDGGSSKDLLSGIESIAKAVKVTLGPSGKNVLIRTKGNSKPFATKDGVTVAAQIVSENLIEQQAIEAMQDVANNADNEAGDGTTTATILAEAIYKEGLKSIENGDYNVIDVKRGIDLGVKSVVTDLKKLAIPCTEDEDLMKVGLISSNNDSQVAKVVVDAFKVSGNQGVVNIKRSRTKETHLTSIKGMTIDTGFISPYFINNHANDNVHMDEPYVYLTNEKIGSVTDNLDLLLKEINENQKSLLIVCEDIDSMVLQMLIENYVKGSLKVCVCKAPGFGENQNENLRDMGIVLGKRPFMKNDGLQFNDIVVKPQEDSDQKLESILNYLPQAEKIIVTENRLSIVGPNDDLVSKEELKAIEDLKLQKADVLRDQLLEINTEYEKAQMQARISRLTDGIAYINIGAISDMEYDEKQHRFQDTLYAVKSAAQEGIIPGGGTTLCYISDASPRHENKSYQVGIDAVYKAIQEPFNQILRNVGIEIPEEQMEIVKNEFNHGIDARSRKFSSDMMEQGIIDPVKVTRVALENAASIVGMLLTTDCVIVDKEAYEKNNNQMMM